MVPTRDIGIYPHRVPTTSLAIATERGYDDIAAIIREAEATRGHVNRRYESASTPPPPPEFTTALNGGDERAVIAFLESSPLLRERPELIHHGPDGTTLLHLAAARLMPEVAVLGAVARRGCQPRDRDPGSRRSTCSAAGRQDTRTIASRS